MTVEAQEVYTRDVSSGTVHLRYRVPGQDGLQTNEADNLDEAGEYEIIEEPDELDETTDFCQRCFPPDEAT